MTQGDLCPYHLYRQTDFLALEAIRDGRLIVNPHTGAITHPDGHRAEYPDLRNGSGRVEVSKKPSRKAQAHRVVYIAVYGLIEPHVLIVHKNGKPWDNRPINLAPIAQSGVARQGTLIPFKYCAHQET